MCFRFGELFVSRSSENVWRDFSRQTGVCLARFLARWVGGGGSGAQYIYIGRERDIYTHDKQAFSDFVGGLQGLSSLASAFIQPLAVSNPPLPQPPSWNSPK